MRQILSILVFVSSMASCESSETSTPRQDSVPAEDSGAEVPESLCEPNTASVLETIFRATCSEGITCHGSARPVVGLDLEAEGIEERLTGRAASWCEGEIILVPGSPEESLLYAKLTAPPCGEQMPIRGTVTEDDIACIARWIEALPPCETCGTETCVNLLSAPEHCGACGVSCATGLCTNGACGCEDTTLTLCGETCVDTAGAQNHCGACDVVCPPNAQCLEGSCVCPEGTEICGETCVDTSSNAAHCGSCGNACTGSEVCRQGLCSANCGALQNCDGSCVDNQTSIAHCGACGNACGQGQVCQAGACVCPNNGTLCDGFCVDTQSSDTHCGACGNACEPGSACNGGACACGTAVSFAADVQPIFTANCATQACHGGRRATEGLNLESGQAYGNLVNVPSRQCSSRLRVEPGSTRQSYLMNKLTGTDLCFGTAMPKAGTTLPQVEIDAISAWICGGALDN